MSAASARPVAALAARRRPRLEAPKTIVVWSITSLAVSLALCLTAPALFGYRTMAVLSGSMEPNLDVGGVVVSKRIPPLDARLGDIVTFKDPGRADKLVSHRLTAMKVRGNTVFMTTRGDANDASESWGIPKGGEVGRVEFHVPKLGYLQQWLNGRAVHIVLVLLLVGTGVFMIVDIWRPKRPAAGEAEGDPVVEEGPIVRAAVPVEEATAVLASATAPTAVSAPVAPAQPVVAPPARRRVPPAAALAAVAGVAVLAARRRRGR